MTGPRTPADRARARDRRVYWAARPLLFVLLAVLRRRPVLRLGRTVLVHDTSACHQALTGLRLDRTGAGTTGAAVRQLAGPGALFDQEDSEHRRARRAVAMDLGAAGTERLRQVWEPVLHRGLAPLPDGAEVDLVPLARELSGVTVCALLRCPADPLRVAEAAGRAAAAAARDHLPGLRLPGRTGEAAAAAARLGALLDEPGDRVHDDRAPGGGDNAGLRAMLALAAVNTTVALLPRAAAWCADAELWAQAADPAVRPGLVDELLRVTAPSPVLPRRAGADGVLAGRPVRAGDRLILIARHAAQAHRRDPDGHCPAEAATAQLVFGAGPHACPGARLARAQLTALLAALAPLRPAVVRARADLGAALPGWRTLVIRAGRAAPAPGRAAP